MKYSHEYKRMGVELYRQGEWPETPAGIQREDFRKMIRNWTRIEDSSGPEALQHKNQNKEWTAEQKKVVANIINRDFSTDRPLQKWTTDVSQFTLPWGRCYLSPILDMNTNEIISYNLSLSPNMEQIKDMLHKAFERFSLCEWTDYAFGSGLAIPTRYLSK